MEVLWKTHNVSIEKATTTLDELMDALGVKGARAIGLSTRELREQLQEWGTEIATRVPAEPTPPKRTKEQEKKRKEFDRIEGKRQKDLKERFDAQEFDEPIYPEEKDKKEWEKRGRPSNPAKAKRWEEQMRRKIRVKKPKERMIGGKKTKVTPVVQMKKPFQNLQSGPVEQPQKIPKDNWVYLDDEEDTMGKSYPEILKATSQRIKFIESIKDLPPQERKEKMAEFHNRYKHKRTIPSIAGKPKIFWTAKNLQKPRRSEKAGRMLGHKIPKQTLNNPSFMISALYTSPCFLK